MPMMARMRELAPAFIITVGVLFVLFMVISDSNVLEAFGARSNNVGSINGKNITITEFDDYVNRARENQRSQTGQDIEEDQMSQFRDQVWDALVTQILTEQMIEKYGIKVTDDEIREAILGDNPPEFLKRNFIDSLGNFNREAYLTAIKDTRNKDIMVQAEEFVKQQLISDKLTSLLTSTVNVSEGEIYRKFVDRNIRMNAEFALVETIAIADSLFNPSDDELKSYYNDNADQYKVDEQRKLLYVTFTIKASKADTTRILETLTSVLARAQKDTGEFKNIVDIYSETPYSRDTLEISALPAEISAAFAKVSPNSFVGPALTSQGGVLYKFYNTVPGGAEQVRAQHILISSTGDDAKDLAEANRIYDEIVKGLNFSAAAQKYSSDKSNAGNGGDLGWFGKGAMVKPFEDAAFSGKVDVVQKPVKTSYGYHIIKVTGKTNSKYVVEKVSIAVKPSAGTIDKIVTDANDFAYLAEKNGFEKTASEMKYTPVETTPFTEDVFYVPGIGYNKSIIHFAFDNSISTVSPAFNVQGSYVVFKISDVIKAGVKKFEDVKAEIRPQVITEMKFKKAKEIAQNVKSKVGSDLSKAPSVNPIVKLNNADQFTTSGSVPNVGTDYAFSAAAASLALNTVSEPVKGNRGYYLIKVTSRSAFDSTAYAAQKPSIRSEIFSEKKSSIYNQWLNDLKENADIVDKRYLFYR